MATYELYHLSHVPSGLDTFSGINSSGTVVGFSYVNGANTLFTIKDGVITVISDSAEDPAFFGINDNGVIIGDGFNGPSQGFTYSAGSFISLPTRSGYSNIEPFGINNSEKIVGSYNTTNGLFGFVLKNGTYKQISVPGSSATEAYGINDSGDIVGLYNHPIGGY